jgi:hypothetical protein
MSDDKPRVLTILERLNEARIAGNTALVDELERDLDAFDARAGYRRGTLKVVHDEAPLARYSPRSRDRA